MVCSTPGMSEQSLKLSTNNLFVANGRNFPDALAASPLVVKDQGSMFLVESNKIPKEIE